MDCGYEAEVILLYWEDSHNRLAFPCKRNISFDWSRISAYAQHTMDTVCKHECVWAWKKKASPNKDFKNIIKLTKCKWVQREGENSVFMVGKWIILLWWCVCRWTGNRKAKWVGGEPDDLGTTIQEQQCSPHNSPKTGIEEMWLQNTCYTENVAEATAESDEKKPIAYIRRMDQVKGPSRPASCLSQSLTSCWWEAPWW